MTARRDRKSKKDEPKSAKRPRDKTGTVKDLDPGKAEADVKGGQRMVSTGPSA